MKALISIQLRYIFTGRTTFFIIALALLMIALMIQASGCLNALPNQILQRNMNLQDFVFESVFFMKLCIWVLLIYLTYRFWLNMPLEIVLMQRVSRLHLYMSQLLASIIVLFIYLIVCAMYYMAIAYLRGFSWHESVPIRWISAMGFMSLYYLMLMMVMMQWTRHILSCFFVMLGGLISSMLLHYEAYPGDISLMAIIMNGVFINVHITYEEGITLLYDYRSMTVVIFTLFLLGLTLYLNKEL